MDVRPTLRAGQRSITDHVAKKHEDLLAELKAAKANYVAVHGEASMPFAQLQSSMLDEGGKGSSASTPTRSCIRDCLIVEYPVHNGVHPLPLPRPHVHVHVDFVRSFVRFFFQIRARSQVAYN